MIGAGAAAGFAETPDSVASQQTIPAEKKRKAP